MIRPVTHEDISRVAPHLTDAGRKELAEVYGMSAEECLRRNLAASTEAWAMVKGETVLCLFGVAPLSVLEGLGEFWIVSTSHICGHRFAFARACRKFRPLLLERWSELRGVVEHSREDVVTWARWLGAEILPRDTRMSFFVLKRGR